MTSTNADLMAALLERARGELRARAEALGRVCSQADPLVDPTATVAQLIADATRFGACGDVALAHLHWQAATVLAPDNKVAALRFAQSLQGVAGPKAAQEALAMLVHRFPDFAPARLGFAAQLAAMKNYDSALRETEAILDSSPDQPAALMIRADCLHHQLRDQAAVDDLTRAMHSSPQSPGPRLKLAALLLGLGQFDAVLALCEGQVHTDAKMADLYLLGARALFRQGHLAAAALRFSALTDLAPGDPRIRLAQVQEHLDALDFAGALPLLSDVLVQYPDTLQGYRMSVQCLAALGRDKVMWQVLQNAPDDLRHSRPFQLTVMLPASQSQFRVDACRAIIAAHDAGGLPVDQCLPLIDALWIHGDRTLAHLRLTDLASRYPDDLAVMRKCISILGSRSPAELHRIKSECLAGLSPLQRCQLLAGLPVNLLTTPERHLVATWMIQAGHLQTAVQHRNFLLRFQHETDAAVIDLLLARYQGTAPFLALITPSLVARRGHQSTRPDTAVPQTAPADLRGFSRICLQSARLAQVTPDVPDPLCATAKVLSGLLTATDRCHWMDSADDPHAALALCDWIAARIRTGQPTSVIRLGDGEGRFLPYATEQTHLQAEDQAQVQRDPWWGAALLTPAQADDLSSRLKQVIAGADLLGIPPMTRLSAEFGWSTALHRRDCRGLAAIFDHLAGRNFRGHLGSCNLHADLDRWGLYGRLLAGCASVSVVSCHDLTDILAQQFQVATRVIHRIPGEYRYRRRFTDQQGQVAQDAADTPIFPDVFDAVMARLDPHPGEVHLVSAGFLGKFFCDRIRTKGGIAIDIGSQADRWASHLTRSYFTPG